MVLLEFGIPTITDMVLILLSLISIYVLIAVAYHTNQKGGPSWLSRKIIHIGISSTIGLSLHSYNNLTGPGLVLLLFLGILILGKIVFREFVSIIVRIASRENGSKQNTVLSGIMAIAAYTLVFIIFHSRPELFTSAILAVSWGDGSGEIIGRPFGTHHFKVWGNKRSLEGSVSVFLFSLLGFVTAYHMFSDNSTLAIIPSLILVALSVTLVEAFSISWSDNFLIPIVVAILMALLISV